MVKPDKVTMNSSEGNQTGQMKNNSHRENNQIGQKKNKVDERNKI
jgi:hypothetical protein